MPLLTIHHKTEYRYDRPVYFGEHHLMVRPRDGHDMRVLSCDLDISPQPSSLRWVHDVFGNNVAVATFQDRAERLTFQSTVTVEHDPVEEIALNPGEDAYYYPFRYDHDELPDLRPSMTPQYADPDGALADWARQFLNDADRTPTLDLLVRMTHGIKASFTYRKRYEHGTQHPLDTLNTSSGTCRDFALLMIEALRRLGIAARFVTGYLFVHRDMAQDYLGNGYVGGGSTHAWVRAYLPSAGWVEFDPTNGIVGNRDLVRVAIARDPRQAVPLHGSYAGPADAFIGMDVSINVTSASEEAEVRQAC